MNKDRKQRYYTTSEIARAAGVHPNTVRKYEEWGFLPPIPRTTSNYRVFTENHLDQMKLARLAMLDGWPGRELRGISLELVRSAAAGELSSAMKKATEYLDLLHDELKKADAAAKILEQWSQEKEVENDNPPLRIRDVSRLLRISVDRLRHWERNGLIKVPQDPKNRYRLYGTSEIKRLRIIYILAQAGYSTMSILRMLLYLEKGDTENLRKVLDTPGPEEDIYGAADNWLSSLARWEQQVRILIKHLESMRDKQSVS